MSRRLQYQEMTDIHLIVIHSTATYHDMDIGVEEIDQWHRERGWPGIGYHYVIRRDGTVEAARPESIPGIHARGYNRESLGIALVGGVKLVDGEKVPDYNFTDEQMEELARLVAELQARYPHAAVLGHGDLEKANTACPSFDVLQWALENGLNYN